MLNHVDAKLKFLRTADVCQNHIQGTLDAQLTLFADIMDRHRVLKESQSVKLKEGCF